MTRDLQLIDQRNDNLAAASGETETTRIEQTRGKSLRADYIRIEHV